MRRKDWEAEIKEKTNGEPFVSENQLRQLGYGPASIKRLVRGLDKYRGGKGGYGRYSVADVAERIMESRL